MCLISGEFGRVAGIVPSMMMAYSGCNDGVAIYALRERGSQWSKHAAGGVSRVCLIISCVHTASSSGVRD